MVDIVYAGDRVEEYMGMATIAATKEQLDHKTETMKELSALLGDHTMLPTMHPMTAVFGNTVVFYTHREAQYSQAESVFINAGKVNEFFDHYPLHRKLFVVRWGDGPLYTVDMDDIVDPDSMRMKRVKPRPNKVVTDRDTEKGWYIPKGLFKLVEEMRWRLT